MGRAAIDLHQRYVPSHDADGRECAKPREVLLRAGPQGEESRYKAVEYNEQ